MSKSRQATIRSLSVNYSPGQLISWHTHEWAQLVYATRGVMTVETDQNLWVVPTRRAIWVPIGHRHRLEMHGRVCLRTIYTKHNFKRFNRDLCAVYDIPPLMHELIVEICCRSVVTEESVEDRTLVQFWIQQLRKLSSISMSIPMPNDERARKFAKLLIKAPGTRIGLSNLAEQSGAGLRTIQRLFQDELGMSVSRWRNQVRMMAAVQRLGNKDLVTNIAFDLGYESPSSFIHAFRKYFGKSPGRYHGE